MAVVAYLVRAELRRRWKAWAALALLLAGAGGVSLFAFSASHRTSTAMDRFLEEFRPAQAIVVGPELDLDVLLRLPAVEVADGGEYFFLVPDGPDGRPEPGAVGAVNPFSSSHGHMLHSMNEARIIEGRKPDPTEELEVAVDEELAQAYDVGVGDTFPVTAFAPEQVAAERSDGWVPPEGPRFDLEITAIIRRPSDVVPTSGADWDVEYLGTRDLVLTPAFHRAHFQQDVAGASAFDDSNFRYAEVRLRPGADGSQLDDQVADVLPDAEVYFDESEDAVATRHSQRAIGLQAAAVRAFGIVVAVAALLLTVLAASRLLGDQAVDLAVLRSSGLSRGAAMMTAVATVALAASVGAIGAGALATALSPLAPIGLARRAEPDPGVHLDLPLLGAGVLLIMTVSAGVALVSSARAQAAARAREAPRTATLGARLAGRSNQVDLVTALQLGGRATGLRSTARLTVLLACLGVVGSLTFAASVEGLHSDPERFGWDWDLAVGNPHDGARFEQVREEVVRHPAVGEASVVHSGCGALLEHQDRTAEPPLVAVEPLRGSIGPLMHSGRGPSGTEEVALGAVTARQLGVGIGDTILVGSGDCGEGLRPMELTGLVLFNTALLADRVGEGALVDPAALDALSVEATSGLVVVDRAPGLTLTEARADLREDLGRIVLPARAPEDLEALARVRGLPLLVAAFVAVLAMGTLVFTLGSVLRKSRRDLAVLKAVGMAPHQAGRALLVHALTLVALPAAVGAILGVTAGRLTWSLIADGLGAPDLPVVPVLAAVAAVPAALLAALAVAAYPARLAARTRPSVTLRTE